MDRGKSSSAWLVGFVIWHSAALAAPTICVKPGGGNGCYAKIADALAAAQPGDVVGVAAGLYTENLTINKRLTLEGGWNPAFSARDPASFVTVIQPVDPDTAIVTVEGQFDDTSVIAPTIDGFTITGAVSTNHGGGLRIRNSDAIVRHNIITNNKGYLFGGGVWVQNGAPRFENNLITNNTVTFNGYGGGIELESTRATLIGNTIDGNKGEGNVGSGGGVAIVGGGPVALTNNTITNNAAANQTIPMEMKAEISYGGGVSVQGAPVAMIGNLIQKNAGNSNLSGFGFSPHAAGYGGGVYITGSTSFTLTGNTIDQNAAGNDYYVYLMGGGVLIDSSQGQLSGNIISANRANANVLFGNGAGIAVTSSTVTIRGGQIINNNVAINCEGYGGGLFAKDSTVTVDATLVQLNCAANTPAYGMGGGTAFLNSPYTLINAVIVDNLAFNNDTAAGGVFAGPKAAPPDIPTDESPGVLVNNTIANNSGQAVNVAAATTLVNNLIVGKGNATGVKLSGAGPVKAVYNGFYNNATNNSGFPLDPTNIVINPQLTGDYHLMTASPMRDAGTHGPVLKAGSATETVTIPVTDIDAEPRAMIGGSGFYKVDIGADEITGPGQRIVDLDSGVADLTIIGPGGDPDSPINAPTNDWIGYSVLGADVNGDGKADLVTAAEDFAVDPDNSPFTPGRLFGLSNFGMRKLGTIDLLDTPADLTVNNQLKLQHIGSALAGGDLNGDGKSDLIAGSYQDDGAGGGAVWPTVFVFFGGSSLTGMRLLDGAHPADFALRAPGQDFFAFSAKNALTTGDLNGDLKADLIVGDGLANDGAMAGAGAVFVMFGKAGLSGLHDLGATPADFTLYGPAAAAGLQAAAVGRVGGNSQNHLIARTATTAYVVFGPLSAGARHLSTTAADITIIGLSAGGVAVIDRSLNGREDLILGSGDKVYLLPGPLAAGTYNVAAIANRITLTGTPEAVLGVGNVVGDAREDIIIGLPAMKHAFAVDGGVVLGGDTVPAADAAATLVRSTVRNKLGWDVTAGDLDNDGRGDLIVSTWQQDVDSHPDKSQDAGIVHVIYGNFPQILRLLSAQSRRPHGLFGPFGIDLPLAGDAAVEPRRNGTDPRMVLTFNGVPMAADGSLDCNEEVVVTNGDCIAVAAFGYTLIVKMTFNKNACVTVSVNGLVALAGDNDVRVLTHEGDVTANGTVNILDLQAVKNQLNQPVAASNFKPDVNADGVINILDLQAVKNNLNQPALCP